MNLSNARAIIGLNARATPTSTAITGNVQIGANNETVSFPNADVAYSLRAIFAGHGDTATINLETGVTSLVTTFVPGNAQIEASVAIGSITTAGNAEVIVTSLGMPGTPKTILVPVALSDTAAVWAGKVRAALAADADVASQWTVSGTTTAIVLTRKPSATFTVPDGTLNLFRANSPANIALANGTCAGITAAPTSTETAGNISAGVKIYDASTDFEGVAIPSLAAPGMILAMSFKNNGGAAVSLMGTTGNDIIDIRAGSFLTLAGTEAFPLAFPPSQIMTGFGITDLTVTVIGQTT